MDLYVWIYKYNCSQFLRKTVEQFRCTKRSMSFGIEKFNNCQCFPDKIQLQNTRKHFLICAFLAETCTLLHKTLNNRRTHGNTKQ